LREAHERAIAERAAEAEQRPAYEARIKSKYGNSELGKQIGEELVQRYGSSAAAMRHLDEEDRKHEELLRKEAESLARRL
jgi:hypothetical protein